MEYNVTKVAVWSGYIPFAIKATLEYQQTREADENRLNSENLHLFLCYNNMRKTIFQW